MVDEVVPKYAKYFDTIEKCVHGCVGVEFKVVVAASNWSPLSALEFQLLIESIVEKLRRVRLRAYEDVRSILVEDGLNGIAREVIFIEIRGQVFT